MTYYKFIQQQYNKKNSTQTKAEELKYTLKQSDIISSSKSRQYL